MYLKNQIIFFFYFFFHISLFRFVFVDFVLLSLVSFYFVFISLISFRFVSFLLISFRFVFVDFVSFRFVSFSLISFRFVSFLFRFALYRYPENPTRNTNTIWKTAKLNPRSVAKTLVKVKILTGNYTLHANRQKYNQHEVSPICKLCNLEPEDREHFILRCPILETKRKFYLHQLFELLREHSKEQLLNTVREEQETIMLCTMDCTIPILNLDVKKELDLISEIEEITRNLKFDLQNCRAVNIKDCLWFRQSGLYINIFFNLSLRTTN